MRLLLYGMQSSGASILAYTLAQRAKTLAYVDIWNTYAAPEILACDRDIVAKVVVTTAFSLEAHQRRFRPDATVLVLRHPTDTYNSLFGKSYANENGLIDEKFALMDKSFREVPDFDRVLYYEDFVFCPENVIDQFNDLGWKIELNALLFGRSQREIQETNIAVCPEVDARLQYGPGNIHSHALVRGRARFAEPWGRTAHLPGLCPSVFEHYAAMRAQRGDIWHVPSTPILSCQLHAVLRELTSSGPIPNRSNRSGYRLDFTGGTRECRISDAEIVLYPGDRKTGSRLTLSGLPGTPFNRVRGEMHVEHPLAPGTTVRLQLRDPEGRYVADQSYTLRHGAMRNIDISFESNGQFSLSVALRRTGGVGAEDRSGVVLRELRLEQAANR